MYGKAILTVGVIIKKGNKILLVQHGKKSFHLTGTYGLPAGRVESNEILVDACVRETKEETGLILDKKELKRLPSGYYAELDRKDGKKAFVMVAFATNKFIGNLISTDETIPKWFSIEEIQDLELIPNVKEAIEDALFLLQNY